MSFRQFPATDANGDTHIVIEFKPEQQGSEGGTAEPRYELEDGRALQRRGREFFTPSGDLRLSI